MYQSSLSHKGLALIEILIVMTIMMVMIAGGFAGYTRFSQAKKWEQDIQAVNTILATGIQKTASRDMSSISCVTFLGYQIDVDQMQNTVTLSILCPEKREVNRYILKSSWVNSVSHTSLQIAHPYGTLLQPYTFTLSNVYGVECQTIQVSQQGVITLPQRANC